MRKGCAGRVATRNFTSGFGDRTSFRAKGLRRTRCMQLTILLQFLAIERHFVRKGCAGRAATRNFTSVFGDRTSFRAKGLRRTRCNSQFYFSFWRSNVISCERVAPGREKSQFYIAFRAVSLALPRTFKRESKRRREQEGKRARGQESKRARCEDVKMRRCEDVRMWRCEDVRMRRCEDEKMFHRPPLLEEPCTQTLSGKITIKNNHEMIHKKPL